MRKKSKSKKSKDSKNSKGQKDSSWSWPLWAYAAADWCRQLGRMMGLGG